jgi:hemin uptake protein HemP
MATESSGSSTARDQQGQGAEAPADAVKRLQSRDLFRHGREVEIDHEGRIYRLRLTQLNKLILTA